MAGENGNRELGAIQATLEGIQRSLDKQDGMMQSMSAQLVAHGESAAKRDSRLDDHENQLGKLWSWKDASTDWQNTQGTRIATYIGAASVVVGGIVWLVGKLA